LNTQISAATGSLSWMCTEWFIRKRPSVLGIISGALAGLVCITPGAGYLDTTGAVVCGALAGPTCFAACQLKKIFQFDDALDAFGIHGPGGILGGILTGFLAKEDIGGTKGVFEGNPKQLGLQLYGIVISIVWSVVVSYVLLKLIDWSLGLRVGRDEELIGLDMVCHGESVLPRNTGDWETEDNFQDRSRGSKSGSEPNINTSGSRGGNNGTDWHEGIANNSTTNSSRRASAEMSFHTSQHDARRVPPAAAAAAMRPEEPPATSLNYGIA